MKLGGSVITEKSRTDYNVRSNLLKEIFSDLKHTQDTGLTPAIILVHGAGGHIHHLAQKYKLRVGTKDDAIKHQNAVSVQETCARLNADITKIAVDAGLQIQTISTHSVIQNNDAQIQHCDVNAIEEVLHDNQTPILYGDMVPDLTLDLSICSGDAVVAHLVKTLGVRRALFASDIDGIFTEDPHTNPKAQLIEEVSLSDLANVSVNISGSHNVDTTGGLKGKLDACSNLFDHNPSLEKIEIFNGLKPENFEKVFAGEPFPHTTVTK